MTNDAWRFKTAEWMVERGFKQVVPKRGDDGAWVQTEAFGSPSATYVPVEPRSGGEYWLSADADWYRARGYVEENQVVGDGERAVFIHPDDFALGPVRWRRAELRAAIDARVAEWYGLSVPEYARVLTAFPLLDRDQPPLEGDRFVTDATDDVPRGVEGVDWEETDFGVYELKPRSFITRDLALLTYMCLKGVAPPQDLHAFYRDEVGLDPDGPLSRFRVGSVLDLIDRVELAREAGAVAYVPSR